MTKEELEKKFNIWVDENFPNLLAKNYTRSSIFDFFYAEIEAREKQMIENSQNYSRSIDKASGNITELQSKVLRLESLVVAAEEVEQATHKLMSGLAKDGTAIDGFTDAWNKCLTYRKLKLEYQISINRTPESEPSSKQGEKENLYNQLKNWLIDKMYHANWSQHITKDDGQYFAINDTKRFVGFNYDLKFGKTWFGIREDGDTRTVFNGIVETLEDAKRIWDLTDTNYKPLK